MKYLTLAACLAAVTLAVCLEASSTMQASAEPKLILLTQSGLHETNGSEIRAWPSYIATKKSHIETLPFDGIAIHNPRGHPINERGPLFDVRDCG